MEAITKQAIKEVIFYAVLMFVVLGLVIWGMESQAATYGDPWYEPYAQSHDAERSYSENISRDAYINETWSSRYEAQDQAIKLDRIEQQQRLHDVLDAIGQ